LEIHVEERLTGRQLRARILAKHGSREALEAAARKKGGAEAKADLVDLRLLDGDPRRLDAVHRVTTIAELTPEDLGRLTVARLQLLDVLAASSAPRNVTELADALGRDKKNVSEDLRLLEDLGLIESARKGREKRVSMGSGREIRLVFAA